MRHSLFILLFFFSVLIISCNRRSAERPLQDSKDGELVDIRGETLAKTYCSGCHMYPDPNLLNKDTWKYSVLPQMGYRMGIYNDTLRQSLIETSSGGKLVEEKNIFPLTPIIDEKEWELIQEYYFESAPDSLTVPVKKIKIGIPGLRVGIPEFHISPPMITAIKYHDGLRQVFIADVKADYSTINILNNNLESISTLAVPSPVSHIDFKSDTILATLMGGFMPTDDPSGSIIKIFRSPDSKEYTGFTTIIDNLQRPVYANSADINGDDLEDIIVCEFGNHTGKLSLFINQISGEYEKKILSPDPGAIKTILKDLNHDGLPDIVALMAQGNERIDVYYNQGDGNFKVSNLLRFPPSYGSVGLSMVDWNKDGHEDIIYVNGDNADHSMMLKPYHGLRIFLNDGENNFKEAFFQHQNGAYKAISYDFDNDGDLDIALTSFFSDLVNTPEEGFLFMKNVSTEDSIQFDLYTFKQASLGRWLIMETMDLDNNNFPELIMGSFAGMGVSGDTDGKIGTKLVERSPTIIALKFDVNTQ